MTNTKGNIQYFVMAPNKWHGQWMNRQQIFSRIGKIHDCVYTNGPFMSWDTGTRNFKQANWLSSFDNHENVALFSPGKLLTRVKKLPLFDRLVCHLFAKRSSKALSLDKKTVLYLFHPKFYEYTKYIKHDLLIYHAYDDLSKQDGYDEIAEDESQLCIKADYIFACSKNLRGKLASKTGSEKVLFLPNGVNFHEFSKIQSVPKDLSEIKGKTVAYTGSINKKVNLELLYLLTNELPAIQFLLIGPIGNLDDKDKEKLLLLQGKSNFHYLGAKKVNEIAAYMQHVDINIMIYKDDDTTWSQSIYPLKLHEYLATGKPVISSNIPAVTDFKDVVQIAYTINDWKNFILHFISTEPNSNRIELRRSVAKQNTWESRVDSILDNVSLALK